MTFTPVTAFQNELVDNGHDFGPGPSGVQVWTPGPLSTRDTQSGCEVRISIP